MNAKRISLLILTASLSVSLIGCGKSSDKSNSVSSTTSGSSDLSEADKEAMTEIHDELNEDEDYRELENEVVQEMGLDGSDTSTASSGAAQTEDASTDDSAAEAYAEYLDLCNSFTLDSEVENGSFNNMYHQLGDMVFKEDGTMTYEEAEKVIESSALFSYLTNIRDDTSSTAVLDGSDTYSDMLDTMISPNGTVGIDYFGIDENGENDWIFSVSLINPTDEMENLNEAYVNRVYLGSDAPISEWYPHGICVGMSYNDLIEILESSGLEKDDNSYRGYDYYEITSNNEVSANVASLDRAFGELMIGNNYYHKQTIYVMDIDMTAGTVSSINASNSAFSQLISESYALDLS